MAHFTSLLNLRSRETYIRSHPGSALPRLEHISPRARTTLHSTPPVVGGEE
jgi:hypothetical protein